jgi:2-iminobutanoate/2-iminopropanoate deaminase
MKRPVFSAGAPAPGGPYSPALVVGELVFVSGQRPVDPGTGAVVDGFEAQVHQVFANLTATLEAAGASLADVVRIGAHLADIALFDRFNSVYTKYLQEPFPTRTTVGSQLRGILVEIDAIAVLRCSDKESMLK